MFDTDHQRRAQRFLDLHAGPEPLLLPNPPDAGTACLLAQLGFEALGTTSLGLGLSRGRRRATLAQILDNCREIAEATPLPVTVDLENGFAPTAEGVADAIRAAAEAGAVGASIEDATADSRRPIYAAEHAVERVRAAVEAARALPLPFVVTARAENFLHGVRDLDDTIARLRAFEAAGADVLYAPGLRDLDEMRAVVESVERPVNVVMGFADPSIGLDDLRGIGVRRVSIGGALSRLALRAFLDGATQMLSGRFTFVRDIAPIDLLQRGLS